MHNLESPKAVEPDFQSIPLNDVDTFAAVMQQWHKKGMELLIHTLSVPAGTEVQIGEDAPKILDGDFLQGFRLGLEVAIVEMGTLPFTDSESEKSDAQSETPLSEPA